jgi:hypothetical protein
MRHALKLVCGTALTFALLSGSAFADWVLDNNKSALYFVSIKKQDIAETHTFKKLSGLITSAGQGTLTIDLGSLVGQSH